jgi:hypothetical protein
MASTSENHEKAPLAAEFVRKMRAAFGDDLKVVYVKEGDFELGERDGTPLCNP